MKLSKLNLKWALMLSVILSCTIGADAQEKKGEKKYAIALTAVIPLGAPTKSVNKYFLIVLAAEEKSKKSAAVKSYIVSVPKTSLGKAKKQSLTSLSKLTIASAKLSNVNKIVETSIMQNIRGAVVSELDKTKLNQLLGGGKISLSNTALASNAAEDVLNVAAGVGTVVATTAPPMTALPLSAIFGGGGAGALAMAGAVGAVISSGATGFYAATGLLNLFGANSGYTLGDAGYDAYAYLSGENSNQNNQSQSGGQNNQQGNNDNNDNNNQNNQQQDDNTDGEDPDNDNDDGDTDGGTTLPPDFGNGSDPGKNIELLIVLRLSANNALGKSVVTSPLTKTGQPLEGTSVIPLEALMYFDAMLGGGYFKMVKRALDARKGSNTTPNPINDKTSGFGTPMVIEIIKCPHPLLESAAFEKAINSAVIR